MEVRSVKKDISLTQLKEDLDRYEKIARDNGCTHVKIMEIKEVVLDYRAKFKCSVPKCPYYNTNINCPPYTPSYESIERFIKQFQFSLLVGVEMPSSFLTRSKKGQNIHNTFAYEHSSEVMAGRKKIPEIISKIESKAFYDGYYFATAFSAGPCKALWCMDVECQALVKGKSCRYPLRSRPSMEGCGIDVFGTVTNAGWEIYPIGDQCQSNDIPYGLRVGIVFIY